MFNTSVRGFNILSDISFQTFLLVFRIMRQKQLILSPVISVDFCRKQLIFSFRLFFCCSLSFIFCAMSKQYWTLFWHLALSAKNKIKRCWTPPTKQLPRSFVALFLSDSFAGHF